MGLKDQLNQEYVTALKKKDERTVSVVRLLKTAIKNQEIEAMRELSEEEIQAVVRRLIKQGKDALQDFERGQRADLVEQTKTEIAQLQTYVPESLGEEDLSRLVDEAIKETGAESQKDMGRLIGIIMKKSEGRADGTLVRALVAKRFS